MSTGTTTKKRRIEVDFVDPPTPVDLNLKLLRDQRDCDVFFLVGPDRQRIGAHKVILRARSRYFEASLSERWKQGSSLNDEGNVIVLKDEEPLIFRSFLEHIYAYVFSPKSPREAVKLLHMAQYYQVSTLAARCEEELAKPFQPDDLLEIFVLSRNFGLENVMSKAGKTMADYFTQLVKSPAFENADEATMIYLLERDDLNVKELKLFGVFRRWVAKRMQSLSDYVGWIDVVKSLIPLIRFPTMDPSKFAQVVAPVKMLSLQTTCDLLMYFLSSDEEKRKVISREFPFSTVPRKNDMASVDLYKKKCRPGKGIYLGAALKRCSNVRDILTIEMLGFGAFTGQVVSLVLESPRYGKPLFQNSSEVEEMNLPITVGISCSKADRRGSEPTWTSEEVVVTLGSGQVVLTLETPWILSAYKLYKITTRFLSDVYTVPKDVVDWSLDPWNPRKRVETFDFFTATVIRGPVRFRTDSGMGLLYIRGYGSTAGASTTQVQSTSMSSGLHLIRSIQIKSV